MVSFADYTAHGLSVEALVSTAVYAILGIMIMLLAIVFVNKAFRLNLHKELVSENNVAFGVLIGGLAIAVAIIIAGTINS